MNHICVSCRDNETSAQVKAGCGHLVYLCADCRDDLPVIRHEGCCKCKGQLTPEEDNELVLAHDAMVSDNYGDFDDFDSRDLQPITEELGGSYYDEEDYIEPYRLDLL